MTDEMDHEQILTLEMLKSMTVEQGYSQQAMVTDSSNICDTSTNDEDEDDDDEDYSLIDREALCPISRYADDAVVSNLTDTDSTIGMRKNILDVKVPRHMLKNVPTGFTVFDRLMTGDGVTPSTACLITGVPGSGKSSMMIQVSDSITKSGNIAIYNSREESAIQMSRTSSRMKLKYGFEFTNYENVFDIISHVRKIQDELYEEYVNKFETLKENGASTKRLLNLKPRQVFLTLDSLQTLEMPNWDYDQNGNVFYDSNGEPIKKPGKTPSGDNMYLNIARYLSSTWCKKTYGILFLIGQVTKDGEFAGKQGIKHWIDAHLHLDEDKARYSPTSGERIMSMTKNRFGIAGTYYSYEIEARGLKFKESK